MARSRATDSATLLRAAATVFEAKGYRSTTIDDIAEAAGVSRPTVYKYTESKQALLDNMVYAVCDETTARLDQVMSMPAGPVDKLRRIVTMHVENATRMRSLYAILFSEQAELSERARATFGRFAHTLAVDLRQLLDDCVAERGPAGPHVDTWIAANLILSMLTALYRWYDPAGETKPDQLGEQVLSLISGILPATPSPTAGSPSAPRRRQAGRLGSDR